MNYQDLLIELRSTRSRNEKIEILKQADEFAKEILELAYNPFKHYYINKLPKVKTQPIKLSIESLEIPRLFNKLSKRTISGDWAKVVLNEVLVRLKEKDAELIGMILKKDLRAGISAKTINLAIPGLIPDFGAMLAKKWDTNRFTTGLCMSLKYDGVRAIFKDGKLLTRNGHELIGLSHITAAIPNSYSLDGELTIPGLHFQDASGYIRSDDPVPNAVYNIFDIPKSILPFKQRYEIYTDVCMILSHGDCIQAVKHISAKSLEHVDKVFNGAIDKGYEGLVIKPWNHLYQTKRSWDWMKLKVQNDEDLPVTGKFEGTGKYKGMLGGLIVTRENGVEVRVGSGFSDAERTLLWKSTDIANKIIEVAYHEETPDGSLRHPVYKGFRFDKD